MINYDIYPKGITNASRCCINPCIPCQPSCIGSTGATGATGPAGANGTTILGSYDTLDDLITAHPKGNPGDAYLVGGDLYVWDEATNSWKKVGNLSGPTGPADPAVIQFSSVSDARVQSGVAGQRSTVAAVGLGSDEIISLSDPIVLNKSAISIKMITGGTLTEMRISLSLTLAASDIPSVVYAQLYSALRYDAREFFPIPNTLVELPVPYFTPAGATVTAGITGLSESIEAGTQLVIVFYNTSPGATAGVQGIMSGAVKIE